MNNEAIVLQLAQRLASIFWEVSDSRRSSGAFQQPHELVEADQCEIRRRLQGGPEG